MKYMHSIIIIKQVNTSYLQYKMCFYWSPWIDRCHITVTFKFIQQTIMGVGRGSSSSKRIQILSSKQSKKGQIDVEKTLNSKAVHNYRVKAPADLLSRIAGKP